MVMSVFALAISCMGREDSENAHGSADTGTNSASGLCLRDLKARKEA